MKWLIVLIVLAVFAGFGVFFGQLNNQPVTVDLIFAQKELSLAVWLALSFLSGVIIAGIAVYLNMWIVVRRRVSQTRKVERAKASAAPTSAAPALPNETVDG